MSNFINEALRFYLDNANKLTEIKQTLVQIKDMLSSGVTIDQRQVVSAEENDGETACDIPDTSSQLLMNSLDIFG